MKLLSSSFLIGSGSFMLLLVATTTAKGNHRGLQAKSAKAATANSAKAAKSFIPIVNIQTAENIDSSPVITPSAKASKSIFPIVNIQTAENTTTTTIDSSPVITTSTKAAKAATNNSAKAAKITPLFATTQLFDDPNPLVVDLKKTGKSCASGSECRSTCCGDAGETGMGKVCHALGASNNFICPHP